MMRKTKWSFIQQASWALLLSLLFILLYGYSFNCGDQEEHLPFVYRLLNPELYSKDYIVPIQTEQFNIRFYYAWLIFFPSLIFPVKWVVFTFYIACLTTINWCIGIIAKEYSKWRSAFVIAPFTGIILFNNFTTGGNSVFDTQLTGSCFATALGCIALFSLVRKRYFAAGVFAGLAALFQVLIGLQLCMLILISVFYFSEFDKIKNTFRLLAGFLLFSAPMLVPILIRQSQAIPAGEENLYYAVLFKFRNAHHYLPQFFPLNDYVKTLAVWMFAIVAARVENRSLSRLFILLTVLVIAGAFIYYLGISVYHIHAIGKLQWFKLCGWITMLSSVPLTAFLAGYPIRLKADSIMNSFRRFILPASALLLVVLFNSAQLPVEKLQHRYQIGNYKISDLSKMHQWVSDSTNINAVILPIPSDDAFLCEAKRSIPVGYKAIIHEPLFLLRWYSAFKDVYGIALDSSGIEQKVVAEADSLYPLRSDSAIHYNVKIDYRIWDTSIVDPSLLEDKKVIHREGNYLLMEFRADNHN